MSTQFRLKIKGVPNLQKALRDPRLVLGPIKNFLEASVFAVQKRAKEKVPVDIGRLRDSIDTEVKGGVGRIFPRVNYAAAVEFGSKPHWPPRGALQPWAMRHGFAAGASGDFLVRRAISRKGTQAQPFMEPALRESENDIDGFLVDMGREIERVWASHG